MTKKIIGSLIIAVMAIPAIGCKMNQGPWYKPTTYAFSNPFTKKDPYIDRSGEPAPPNQLADPSYNDDRFGSQFADNSGYDNSGYDSGNNYYGNSYDSMGGTRAQVVSPNDGYASNAGQGGSIASVPQTGRYDAGDYGTGGFGAPGYGTPGSEYNSSGLAANANSGYNDSYNSSPTPSYDDTSYVNSGANQYGNSYADNTGSYGAQDYNTQGYGAQDYNTPSHGGQNYGATAGQNPQQSDMYAARNTPGQYNSDQYNAGQYNQPNDQYASPYAEVAQRNTYDAPASPSTNTYDAGAASGTQYDVNQDRYNTSGYYGDQPSPGAGAATQGNSQAGSPYDAGQGGYPDANSAYGGYDNNNSYGAGASSGSYRPAGTGAAGGAYGF